MPQWFLQAKKTIRYEFFKCLKFYLEYLLIKYYNVAHEIAITKIHDEYYIKMAGEANTSLIKKYLQPPSSSALSYYDGFYVSSPSTLSARSNLIYDEDKDNNTITVRDLLVMPVFKKMNYLLMAANNFEELQKQIRFYDFLKDGAIKPSIIDIIRTNFEQIMEY